MPYNNNINIIPNNPFHSLEQIHQGIEDYFECRLSQEQEKLLRQALSTTEYRTTEIEECIAVMGFKGASRDFLVEERPQSQDMPDMSISKEIPLTPKQSRRTWITMVAASILAAILIAVPLLISNGDPQELSHSDCYAYVDGNKITDEDVIMRMLMDDFDEFDQSLSQINDDFDSTMEYLSQIIEENENPL